MLPKHIEMLADQIARKPNQFTPRWAANVEEAFDLYTRTSTINLLQSANLVLIEHAWPFPAYLDLTSELDAFQFGGGALARYRRALDSLNPLRRERILRVLLRAGRALPGSVQADLDRRLCRLFTQNKRAVFAQFAGADVLETKQQLVRDIEGAFERNLWSACISTAMPLLDLILRSYFRSKKLNITLQTLRNAFIEEAKIGPKDLMPGFCVEDGLVNPDRGNSLAPSLDRDLRLPGVYLSSFLEFSKRYYEWYLSADGPPRTSLNRHAVIHCAAEFGSKANAARILTFIDLTLRLERPLKILIHGASA